METHIRATERHLPYWITLSFNTGDHVSIRNPPLFIIDAVMLQFWNINIPNHRHLYTNQPFNIFQILWGPPNVAGPRTSPFPIWTGLQAGACIDARALNQDSALN